MEADKNKKGKAFVKDYNDMSTDTIVDIEITFNETIDEKTDGSNNYNNLEKVLKLYTNLNTNNMHLFNEEEKLVKYDNEKEIIDGYYPVRLKYYQKRKDYLIKSLENELKVLSNKARYIQDTLEGTIDLRRKNKDEILSLLCGKKFDVLDNDKDYKYLLKMTMDSVSEENAERLLKDRDNKSKELIEVQGTMIEDMWLKELDELIKYLDTSSSTGTKNKCKKK